MVQESIRPNDSQERGTAFTPLLQAEYLDSGCKADGGERANEITISIWGLESPDIIVTCRGSVDEGHSPKS